MSVVCIKQCVSHLLLKFRQGKISRFQVCLQLVLRPMTDISTEKGQITFYTEQECDGYVIHSLHMVSSNPQSYNSIQLFGKILKKSYDIIFRNYKNIL